MFSLLLVLLAGRSLSEETPNLWAPLEDKVTSELIRLDKSTVGHDCHATCSFSVHMDLSDYETAKDKCASKTFVGFPAHGGMQLASIHSELENRIATLMLQYAYGGEELEGARYEGPSNWAWIGLEKVNHTSERPNGAGKVVWEEEDWEWVDGTRLDGNSYTHWMDKADEQVQPDMKHGVGSNYQVAGRLFRKTRNLREESGVWDDTFKSMVHPYICKFNVPVHYIVYPELLNWYEAKASCEAKGFYFAKIRNKAENDRFVAAAQLAFSEDRHEPKFHHENWIWIGATDLNEWNEFRFYDGEEINFTIPWARKQHDNKTNAKQGSQDHAAVARWGEWDDSFGNDWKRPYACQCNPNGMELDEEMKRINEEWEHADEKKKEEKERKKAEKEARKEARRKKKEEAKARKEQKKKEWEAKQAEKAAEKERKQREKEAKQAEKEAKKAEKAAEKERKQREKEAKQAEKEAKKAEKAAEKERKQREKEAKQAEKEAKQQEKADKKAAKEAAKAAKKAAKEARKAAKEARKAAKDGNEEIEKRNSDMTRGQLEKRELVRGLEKRELVRGLEKRELVRGLEKRDEEARGGLEKRSEFVRGLEKRDEEVRGGLEKRESELEKRQWSGNWVPGRRGRNNKGKRSAEEGVYGNRPRPPFGLESGEEEEQWARPDNSEEGPGGAPPVPGL